MRVRGIRGAVQLEQDSASEMLDQVSQLLTEMLKVNQVKNEDLISIILTATPDLKSEFPAAAARQIGLGAIPLLCSVEIDVKDALPSIQIENYPMLSIYT